MNHYLEVENGLESNHPHMESVGSVCHSLTSEKMPAKRKVPDSKAEKEDVQSRSKTALVDSKAEVRKAVTNVLFIELTLNLILVYADPVTANRILQTNRYLRAYSTKRLWHRLAESWLSTATQFASILEQRKRRMFNAPEPSQLYKLHVLREYAYRARAERLHKVLKFIRSPPYVPALHRMHIVFGDFPSMLYTLTPVYNQTNPVYTFSRCIWDARVPATNESSSPYIGQLTPKQLDRTITRQLHTMRSCVLTVHFTKRERRLRIDAFCRRFPCLRREALDLDYSDKQIFHLRIPHLDAPDVLSLKT